ncbi:MAG: hypothetical protein ABUL54_11730, partial [Dongia sp.]
HARAEDCAVSSPAKPVVTLDVPPVVYDTSLNRAAIKKHEIAINRRPHSEVDIILGTTETEIQPSATLQIQAQPDGTGGFCATVASAKTVISWKMVVHVASELKPGSCMYNVVMTHEQGHVDIARGLMGMAKQLIGGALASVARKSATAATPQEASKKLEQAGSAAFNAAMTKINAEMERRQAAHDTPEEYAKGKQACGLVAYYHALGR